jgi:hypothetical protein
MSNETDNRIQFDWDKFQTGNYDVVTKHGRKVEGLLYDESHPYPIQANIADHFIEYFTKEGTYRNYESDLDLFLVRKSKDCTEDKLDAIADKIGELSVQFSELEKKVENIQKWQFNNPNVSDPPMKEIYDENGKFFCYEHELAGEGDYALGNWESNVFEGLNGHRMCGFFMQDILESAIVKSKLGRRYLVFKKLPF